MSNIIKFALFRSFTPFFFIEDATFQNRAETSSIFLSKIGPGVLYFIKKRPLFFLIIKHPKSMFCTYALTIDNSAWINFNKNDTQSFQISLQFNIIWENSDTNQINFNSLSCYIQIKVNKVKSKFFCWWKFWVGMLMNWIAKQTDFIIHERQL